VTTVVVLDYGSGNLASVARALRTTGTEVVVSADLELARRCDGLVVPGVGAFAACWDQLTRLGGDQVVRQRAEAGQAVLAICVGHQILFAAGVEHAQHCPGLGLYPGTVRQLPTGLLPHMGWNQVRPGQASRLFPDEQSYYFVHSYAALHPGDLPAVARAHWTRHEQTDFIAAVEYGSVVSTQFHPEKSGPVGLALLGRWVDCLGDRPRPTRSAPAHPGHVNPAQASPAAPRPGLVILPAVDIHHGQAVQLRQGVASDERVFGDPVQAARRWRSEGADWLHLVDLDAAFGGSPNREAIAQIVAESGLQVELAGGIRDDASLRAALDTGCARVNIGTAAVEHPDWCDEVIATCGPRIAVALDVRGDGLATRGWTATQPGLWSTIDRLNQAGVVRLVVTDTTADGTLSGLNLDLLARVCARTPAAVVASGGVAGLEDLRRLVKAAPGVEGVIIGSALYLGRFALPEAMAVAQGDRV
jgi:phosphoribosylanthranilate isomerase